MNAGTIDQVRIPYWAVAGAVLFAGFYVSFFGNLPPYFLLAGAVMVILGLFVGGIRKTWAVLLGPPVAFCVTFLLEITIGL